MRKILLTLTVICAVALSTSFAQLTLDGQFRPRAEFRNGFKKPTLENDDPAFFIEQRTRLNVGYKADKFRTKLALQDVRIWGEVGQINKTDGLFSVHEAYGDYLFNSKTYLRIGRQELVYDDHRVLGSLDWAAQGRSHDALRFVKQDSLWEFHAAVTWNQDNRPAEPAKLQGTNANAYTTAQGAYANTETNTIFQLANPKSTQFMWFKYMMGKSNVTALVLNDVVQTTDTTTHARQLVGINPTLVAGKIKVAGTFYYQFGKANDSVSYGGLLASLNATYTGSKSIIPTIGFDYLSGEDASTGDKIETFNPLYGTHHKFYGLMDYFYVGNGHGNKGLLDIYVKAVIKTKGKAKFLAHVHQFMAAADVNDPTDASKMMSKGLGTEIDLVYVQPLAKGVVLKAGYSQMISTETMSVIKGQGSVDATTNSYDPGTSGFNGWAWVMINFAPKFL